MKYLTIIITLFLCSNALASEWTRAGNRRPSLPLTKIEKRWVKEYNEFNETCRGGLRDDPKTIIACDRRDNIIGPKLDKIHINPYNYNFGISKK